MGLSLVPGVPDPHPPARSLTLTSTTPAAHPVTIPSLRDPRIWAAINSIRVLAMDAVEQASSGHPGTPMALAPAATILWTRHLKHDPTSPDWPDRDRFVLSCGHASMLLYSLLHLTGYDLSLDEIRAFRQWGSRTPGHPERGHTPGVETTTGPLGQGMANAVGMAMAERILARQHNRPGHEVIDHRTWVLASDGDLMEGVSAEAASLAGHLRLDRLTVIYDDNRITIDGSTDLAFSEDVGARFAAYGWRVLHVADGTDLEAIDAACTQARAETLRPTLIVLRTIIGDPAPTKRNTSAAHGAPLGADEVARTKAILGWPETPFSVPDEARQFMETCRATGAAQRAAWMERWTAWQAVAPEAAAALTSALAGQLPRGWNANLPAFGEGSLATRQASAKTLDALMKAIPALMGGSADLAGSTGTDVSTGEPYGPGMPGRVIHWGIREHAMGACCNGILAHGGLRPWCSTFFVFADYMKPAIRLAALMGLPVIYVFTHDSIGVGEDGPTHQPIDQLAMLRAVPNLVTLRPADANETVAAWRAALTRTDGPTALILTRQKLPTLAGIRESGVAVERGAYTIHDPGAPPAAIILSTGSEVSTALDAGIRLTREGIPTRVVSFPSWELFAAQPASYREQVLPPSCRVRVAIEAGTSQGWDRWTTDAGAIIALDHFGASAPGDRLFTEFGLTADRVTAAVRTCLEGVSP